MSKFLNYNYNVIMPSKWSF